MGMIPKRTINTAAAVMQRTALDQPSGYTGRRKSYSRPMKQLSGTKPTTIDNRSTLAHRINLGTRKYAPNKQGNWKQTINHSKINATILGGIQANFACLPRRITGIFSGI